MIVLSKTDKNEIVNDMTIEEILDSIHELINLYFNSEDNIQNLHSIYERFSLLLYYINKLFISNNNNIFIYSTQYQLKYNELYIKYQFDEAGKKRTQASIEAIVKSEINEMKDNLKKYEKDVEDLKHLSYLCNTWHKTISSKLNFLTYKT